MAKKKKAAINVEPYRLMEMVANLTDANAKLLARDRERQDAEYRLKLVRLILEGKPQEAALQFLIGPVYAYTMGCTGTWENVPAPKDAKKEKPPSNWFAYYTTAPDVKTADSAVKLAQTPKK